MKFDRVTTGIGGILAAALAGLLLSGCANTATPQQQTVATVAASQKALTLAGRTILICYGVPACNRVAPKPQIRAAFDTAYDAVTAAQATADAGGTPDLTATTAAMTALQTIVALLPKTTTP